MELDPVDQVVVIGASSGGLTALRELLGQLPSDLRAAVFITMHVGDQPSQLPSILANMISLKISFALCGEKIQRGLILPIDEKSFQGLGGTRELI
jgi:two-component system chemotaxis response regulator CheB